MLKNVITNCKLKNFNLDFDRKKAESPKIKVKITDIILARELGKLLRISTNIPNWGYGVEREMEKLLILMGFDQDCRLHSFDELGKTFKCRVGNETFEMRMAGLCGMVYGYMHFGEHIVLTNGEDMVNYGFDNANKKDFQLLNYTLNNKDNGNTLTRIYKECGFHIILKNENYSLTIELESRSKLNLLEDLEDLEAERDFEDYLLGLTFPIAIEDIYQKFDALYLIIKELYSKLSIKVEKKAEDSFVVTDVIHLKYGEVIDFAVTRDGKTIMLNNGGWSYRTDNVCVYQKENGLYDIHLQNVDLNKFYIPSVKKQIKNITPEINMVRELKKRIID